jgi:hypothetical protein
MTAGAISLVATHSEVIDRRYRNEPLDLSAPNSPDEFLPD